MELLHANLTPAGPRKKTEVELYCDLLSWKQTYNRGGADAEITSITQSRSSACKRRLVKNDALADALRSRIGEKDEVKLAPEEIDKFGVMEGGFWYGSYVMAADKENAENAKTYYFEPNPTGHLLCDHDVSAHSRSFREAHTCLHAYTHVQGAS